MRAARDFPDDDATLHGCDGVFCPASQGSHVCIPGGMVLHSFPDDAEVRTCRPRPSSESRQEDRSRRGRCAWSPYSLAEGRRKPTMVYPLERAPAVIRSWRGPRTPQHFCNGAAYDVPYSALCDDFKSTVVISDCELFWLRRPFQYKCKDGYFLWLRAWHETHYDGSPLVGGLQGYAFHVLVTGLRR